MEVKSWEVQSLYTLWQSVSGDCAREIKYHALRLSL